MESPCTGTILAYRSEMVTPISVPATVAFANDHKKPHVPIFEVLQEVLHVKGKMRSSVQDISCHPWWIRSRTISNDYQTKIVQFLLYKNRPYRGNMCKHIKGGNVSDCIYWLQIYKRLSYNRCLQKVICGKWEQLQHFTQTLNKKARQHCTDCQLNLFNHSNSQAH